MQSSALPVTGGFITPSGENASLDQGSPPGSPQYPQAVLKIAQLLEPRPNRIVSSLVNSLLIIEDSLTWS